MIKEDVVYIQTIEYYLVTKRKEILTSALTWIELEDIMLSEISQKDKYYIIPFIFKIVRLTENTMVVSRGWRMGEFNGYEVSFLPGDQC